MALTIADRVKETTVTTGTGTVTLAGATTGHRTFQSVVAVGDQCNYVITLDTEWEVGVGTLATSTTLARTIVLSSSNAGALVDFAAGIKNVFLNNEAQLINSELTKDRNLLNNGAMNVCQRPTSVAGYTVGGIGTVDRWNHQLNTMGTWTMSQETDGPASTEFKKSFKVLCTTADAAPAAGDYVFVSQGIEGIFVQEMRKGTATARPLTVSFWVKSNATGTYIVKLSDVTNGRFVSASYTVNVSATWEYKTLTFPADTTGTLTNDTGLQFRVDFWLGAGTTYTGGGALGTTWNTTANTLAVGCTNLAAANNNYWQVTGVQLEIGSIATPFETVRYDDDLWKCYRYFYKTGGATATYLGSGQCFNTTSGMINVPLPRFMRVRPTMTVTASAASDFILWGAGGNNTACTSNPTEGSFAGFANSRLMDVRWAVASGMVAGNACSMQCANANGFLNFSADL